MFIPQSALRRFLNNIKDESISLTEDELSEEVEILREDLPIKFSIKEENNEINYHLLQSYQNLWLIKGMLFI